MREVTAGTGGIATRREDRKEWHSGILYADDTVLVKARALELQDVTGESKGNKDKDFKIKYHNKNRVTEFEWEVVS